MKKIVLTQAILTLLLLSTCLDRRNPVDYINTDMFEIVGECGITGYAEDMAIGDSSIVYVAAGIAGIEVVSVLDPANPVLVGYADPMGEKNIVRVAVVPESNLLLSVSNGKKVSFWDVSNAVTPIWNTTHMSDRTEGIFVWDKEKTGSPDSVIIFAADRDDGLKVNGFYWGDPFNISQSSWWAIENIGFEGKVR